LKIVVGFWSAVQIATSLRISFYHLLVGLFGLFRTFEPNGEEVGGAFIERRGFQRTDFFSLAFLFHFQRALRHALKLSQYAFSVPASAFLPLDQSGTSRLPYAWLFFFLLRPFFEV